MAQQNTIYDPDADQQQTHHHLPVDGQTAPAGKSSAGRNISNSQSTALNNTQNPSGGQSLDRDSLKNAEQEGDSLFNPSGDSSGGNSAGTSQADSPNDLKNSEDNNSYISPGRGLYNQEGDSKNRLQNIRGRLKNALGNKLLVGAGIGGTSLMALIIILLILIGGAYKVVNFAEHVAAYQFARTVSQMASNTDRIASEQIGIDALANDTAGNSAYDQLKAKYTAGTGKVGALWSKVEASTTDKFSPNKIISNFGSKGIMTFNYDTNAIGRQVLKSVTINGVDVAVQSGGLKGIIPGYNFNKNVTFARDFAPAFNSAVKAQDIGPITRARVASEIRSKLGISLSAWVIGKYAGKTSLAADAQAERDAEAAAVGSDSPAIGSASNVNDTAKQARAELDAELNNEAAAQQIASQASNDTLPPKVVQIIDSSITAGAFSSVESALRSILNFISPVYAIATPLCLVYDGSLSQSGPTVDTQSQQLERSAVHVQTAAAQQKDGSNVNGEAAGATDWKLGDITTSNAERRASGIPIDTSSYQPTEASATGQYSIADFGLGSTVGGFVDTVLKPVCPALTSFWVAGGVGVLALITALPSLISGSLTDTLANSSVKELAAQLIGKIGVAKDFSQQLAKDTVKSGAEIGGATLIAKVMVMSQMGSVHNALASGQSYNNDIDSGTNIYANQVNQQQFYGAPMMDQNLGADNVASQKHLAMLNSQQSTFRRYLAVSNPDSLVSRLAISVNGYTNGSLFKSIVRLGGTLLDPIHSLGTLFRPLVSRTTFAAATVTSANTYYGNVQFGYTAAEQNLLDNDPTYVPLENQLALDQSGNEAKIAAQYGKCFDGSDTIGTMLANGDLKRDNNGDLLADDSICSPKSLGIDNNTYGAQMVFRWRVAQSYNNTLDQLTSEQTLESGAASAANNASATVPSTAPSTSNGKTLP